jgi:hypothetical protein
MVALPAGVRNPASPDPAGLPAPRTADPHPTTTSGKRSNEKPHSPPDPGRQVKRQAENAGCARPPDSLGHSLDRSRRNDFAHTSV